MLRALLKDKKMEYDKTHHTLMRNGRNLGTFHTDTIFIKSIPHLVLEWIVAPDGSEKPAHDPIPLDPSRHVLLGWKDCKYMYEFPVEDPRPLN